MPYVRSYTMFPGGAQLRGVHRHPIRLSPEGGYTISESNPVRDIHPIVMSDYIAQVRGMGQSGEVPTEGGNLPGTDVTPIDVTVPTTGPIDTGGTPIDWTNVINLAAKTGLTTAQIIRSLQTPGLVPGTQAIFNPATGQFYNPQTGQVVNPTGQVPTTSVPFGAGLTSSPTLLIVGGLGLAAIVLVGLSGRKS
jgi:hypothetical protein